MQLDFHPADFKVLKTLADANYRSPVDQIRYMLAKQYEIDDITREKPVPPEKLQEKRTKGHKYPKFLNTGSAVSRVVLACLELVNTHTPVSPQTVTRADPSLSEAVVRSNLSSLVGTGVLVRIPDHSPALYEFTPRGTKSAAKLFERKEQLQPKA